MTERQRMKQYATVIQMWAARYNTAEIAAHLDIEEYLVARWIANYREIARAA